MATPAERIEELLNLTRGVDMPTLLAVDRELHLLLEQKRDAQQRAGQATAQEEFCQRYPRIAVDPDLPEHPLEEDKTLIREHISRRLTE